MLGRARQSVAKSQRLMAARLLFHTSKGLTAAVTLLLVANATFANLMLIFMGVAIGDLPAAVARPGMDRRRVID